VLRSDPTPSPSPGFGDGDEGGEVLRSDPTASPSPGFGDGDAYHGRRIPLSEVRRGGHVFMPTPPPLRDSERGTKGGEVLRPDPTHSPSPGFGDGDAYHGRRIPLAEVRRGGRRG